MNNQRLIVLIDLAPNQLDIKPFLRAIELLLDDGAMPMQGMQYSWDKIGRFLEILEDTDRYQYEDHARVARIFDRLLDKAPAQRSAHLAALWREIVYLPLPQRQEVLQKIKEKFGKFTPSRDTWQQEPNVDYPLRSADASVAVSKQAPLDVVQALIDLREPTPPEIRVWDAAINTSRLDVLQLLIQRRYELPLEHRESGAWSSPFLSAAQAAVKGDTRALEMMINMSPEPLIPDDVNQRMKTVLFRSMDAIPEAQLRHINDALNAMSSLESLTDGPALDAHGYSLLARAAVYGDLSLMKGILDAGADINAKSPDGLTALTYARCYGHPEVVQLLQQRHAVDRPASCRP
ncbi:ankyrin repeat domain-containing protein [Paraburkholderia dinghuensis]|uniref:Ankyrin repeat domain-containing protein n=1 Tax=Paraburkholderia dinghuensis TaxID=2305225 RepID=A0A3N6MHP8_9BURK|nr:ankyrin repeat domain-containing protein [Paraburkholderia dinghuensis]RQH00645.1 ankyrin repeat domain-containing protein [Paraburkholderia dinghuensis]